MERSDAQREVHRFTGSLLMLVFVNCGKNQTFCGYKSLQTHFSLGQGENTAFTLGRKISTRSKSTAVNNAGTAFWI